MKYTVLLDPSGEAARPYMVRGTPTTYIVNQDGKLVGAGVGPRAWDGKEALKLFRKILANGKPS